MPFAYHAGEHAVQRRIGVEEAATRGAEHGLHDALPDIAAAFLAEQVMLVVGHRAAGGAVWASVLTGAPGFAQATDPRTLRVAAVPARGDALADALAAGPTAIGVLALEPATRRRTRVNGTAERDGNAIVVRAEQVYANCPKYIATRDPGPLETAGSIGAARRSTGLTPAQQELVTGADTFFVATSHDGTGADASHRGGRPGFVLIEGAGRLSWPDYRGNSMFMTLGNLELDEHAGLLFADWERGDVLQLTGRARTDFDPARAAAFPRAERVVDFDVDAVVELPGALRRRWAFGEASRVSPPAPPPRARA